jgi:hypothetical protein
VFDFTMSERKVLKDTEFPKIPVGAIVVTDYDDTVLESRSTAAIREYNRSGHWKDVVETTPRRILGHASELFENCEKGLNCCVIMTAASEEVVRQEWKASTGKEVPRNVTVITTKDKGCELVKVLKASQTLYQPRTETLKYQEKPLVFFLDDADLHIKQVLQVQDQVEELGFWLQIVHLDVV